MILIGANLPVYPVDRGASTTRHRATGWKRRVAGPSTSVCTVSAYSLPCESRRTPTHCRPAAAETLAYMQPWLAQPFVEAVAPGKRHWPVLRNLLRVTGSAGKLTTDAHIAALAIEHGATIFSADHDFKRFPGVHHVNPLEPVGRGEPVH